MLNIMRRVRNLSPKRIAAGDGPRLLRQFMNSPPRPYEDVASCTPSPIGCPVICFASSAHSQVGEEPCVESLAFALLRLDLTQTDEASRTESRFVDLS